MFVARGLRSEPLVARLPFLLINGISLDPFGLLLWQVRGKSLADLLQSTLARNMVMILPRPKIWVTPLVGLTSFVQAFPGGGHGVITRQSHG